MRNLGKMVLALTAAALVATPVLAQRGGGGGGRGGPRGMQGPGGGVDSLVRLLQNKSVQKELGIEDADVKKVPDALLKALESILKPEQVKRLKEIALQQRMAFGQSPLTDPKIQAELKITDEQKEKLKTVQDEANKERQELFQGGGRGGDFAAMREKMQKLTKETTKKMVAVLDADQKKAWNKMLGEPFEIKFDFPRPPGGGGTGSRPGRVEF